MPKAYYRYVEAAGLKQMMLYRTPMLELLYHQQAWEKVLDASNRDDGVLEVRLGAIMKQMMLYRTPKT